MQPESCISISMSPIVDVTYTRTPAGEKCYDALIQEVRINLSVPFLLHLIRYVMDSFPGDQVDEGIVNHGYENNSSATVSEYHQVSTCCTSKFLLLHTFTLHIYKRLQCIFVSNQEQRRYYHG